jgi:hypothetical protein
MTTGSAALNQRVDQFYYTAIQEYEDIPPGTLMSNYASVVIIYMGYRTGEKPDYDPENRKLSGIVDNMVVPSLDYGKRDESGLLDDEIIKRIKYPRGEDAEKYYSQAMLPNIKMERRVQLALLDYAINETIVALDDQKQPTKRNKEDIASEFKLVQHLCASQCLNNLTMGIEGELYYEPDKRPIMHHSMVKMASNMIDIAEMALQENLTPQNMVELMFLNSAFKRYGTMNNISLQ